MIVVDDSLYYKALFNPGVGGGVGIGVPLDFHDVSNWIWEILCLGYFPKDWQVGSRVSPILLGLFQVVMVNPGCNPVQKPTCNFWKSLLTLVDKFV